MGYLLIVDDDVDGCDPLRLALERSGHEVDCVVNGEEALSHILDRLPDLIILDIYMPQMDGVNLLQILRSYLRLQALPVIVLTGVPDSPHIARVQQLGVGTVLTKAQATQEEILQAVQEHLQQAA